MRIEYDREGTAYLRGTYHKTWRAEEKSEPFRLDTFSPHAEGKTYAETDSMFGY